MASEAHLKSIVSEHKFLVYLEFTVQTSLFREKKVYKQDHLIWVQAGVKWTKVFRNHGRHDLRAKEERWWRWMAIYLCWYGGLSVYHLHTCNGNTDAENCNIYSSEKNVLPTVVQTFLDLAKPQWWHSMHYQRNNMTPACWETEILDLAGKKTVLELHELVSLFPKC